MARTMLVRDLKLGTALPRWSRYLWSCSHWRLQIGTILQQMAEILPKQVVFVSPVMTMNFSVAFNMLNQLVMNLTDGYGRVTIIQFKIMWCLYWDLIFLQVNGEYLKVRLQAGQKSLAFGEMLGQIINIMNSTFNLQTASNDSNSDGNVSQVSWHGKGWFLLA